MYGYNNLLTIIIYYNWLDNLMYYNTFLFIFDYILLSDITDKRKKIFLKDLIDRK